MLSKKIIVLLFLAAIGLAALAGLKQRPVYRAFSTVIVNPINPDLLSAKDTAVTGAAYYPAYKIYMETQKEIIRSRRVAYHVIKNLGLKDPIDDLLKKIKTDIVKSTGVIKISAEAYTSIEASRIANEFARVYVNPKLSQVQADRVLTQDFADVPLAPVWPDKKLNIAMFIILIIAGGISISFFKMPGYIGVKDVTPLKLPVLGSVPKIKPGGKNIKTKIDTYRITEKDPLCMASEAYRSIRTKLLFSLNSSGSVAKSILITSSVPKEGKTISAINLAIMTAHSGESVLLVDAHIKRPMVHSVFNISNDIGLANYLSGDADFNSIIKHPGIDNLFVVTLGSVSHRPVKYISSKNIKLFLEKAGAGFSKIIFDAPPAALLSNMEALLSICDGVALVADNNRPARLLNNSKELLQKKGANIIGVILNNVSL